MTIRHRNHLHQIRLDEDDEIVSIDDRELKEPGYVTRVRGSGDLIACLSRTDCDKD